MSECTGRGGYNLGLVWRHTFPSSSRRPCNPCLGGFSKLKYFFTYLVALKSCVHRRVVEVVDDRHGSCLHVQCTDFMGSHSF